MLRLFGSFFKSKKTTSDNRITSSREFTKKWIPNDVLYRKYQNFASQVGHIERLKRKRPVIQAQIKEIKDRLSAPSGFDLIDRVDILGDEQELMNLETELERIEIEIKALQEKGTGIMDEWHAYIAEAKDYLDQFDLTRSLNVNDILSSTTIFVALKKQTDACLTSLYPEPHREAYTKMSLLFDMKALGANFRVDYSRKMEEYVDSLNFILDEQKRLLSQRSPMMLIEEEQTLLEQEEDD